jgi:hypothetical protein
VCVNFFSLCVVFVNIFVKKKKKLHCVNILLCTIRSNVHSITDTGMRSNSLAFV